MQDDHLPVEVRLAREAMATRFELILLGDDRPALQAAGEQALRSLELAEKLLSFYRGASDLSRMNRMAFPGPVRVHGLLMEFLEACERLYVSTSGAFDPTVAPLMRLWGLTGAHPRVPKTGELEQVRARCGFGFVEIASDSSTVRFLREGVALDPGGVGKGFALDEMEAELREAGVEHALIHGGTSSIQALGTDHGQPWRVGLPCPGDASGERVLTAIDLVDQALSVSTPYGKGSTVDRQYVGHVLDPRSGRPVNSWDLAAVRCRRACDADAAATALLILGEDAEKASFFKLPEVTWLLAKRDEHGELIVRSNGIPTEADDC